MFMMYDLICRILKIEKTDSGTNNAKLTRTESSQPCEVIQCILDGDRSTFDSLMNDDSLQTRINEQVHVSKLKDHRLPSYIKSTSAMCRASHVGSIENIRALVDKGASLYDINSMMDSALHMACKDSAQGIDKMEYLLQRDPQVILPTNKNGRSVLHVAARSGKLPMVEYLVVNYSELLFTRDKFDALPIHDAARKGYKKCLEVFLNHKVNVDIDGNIGMTPLCYAALEGRLSSLQILHKHGADVEKKAINRRGPLHFVVEGGDIDCLRFLIDEFKANINATDNKLNTPLHEASKKGDTTVIKTLVSYEECDLNLTNKYGKSAVEIALDNKHFAIAQYLSEKNIHCVGPQLITRPTCTQSDGDCKCTQSDIDEIDGTFLTKLETTLKLRLKKNFNYLQDEIVPIEHLAYLFEQGAINESELERLQKRERFQSSQETTRELLATLFNKREDSWTLALMESFGEHCPHVVEHINSTLINQETH